MSRSNRFIIQAVCALAGFIVGTIVIGLVVGLLGLYGTLSAIITVIGGLAAAYGGFRAGRAVLVRRDPAAYARPGYPPQDAYGRQYQQQYGQYPQQQYPPQGPYQG